MSAPTIEANFDLWEETFSAIQCDESTHTTSRRHGGDAKWFARLACCGTSQALCDPIVQHVREVLRSGVIGTCKNCNSRVVGVEAIHFTSIT